MDQIGELNTLFQRIKSELIFGLALWLSENLIPTYWVARLGFILTVKVEQLNESLANYGGADSSRTKRVH